MIHEHYQWKKRALIQQNIMEAVEFSRSVWSNERNTYPTEHLTVYPIADRWYGVIDTKIMEGLSSVQYEQFDQALKKGLARRQEGSNGVKLLPKQCIELKINDDIRLVATDIYQNANGESLIVFGKMMDHEAIARLGKNSTSSRIYSRMKSIGGMWKSAAEAKTVTNPQIQHAEPCKFS